MEMRANYNNSSSDRKLPALLAKDVEIVDGKSPVRNANFTANYLKLQENTKFKKTFEHTETI